MHYRSLPEKVAVLCCRSLFRYWFGMCILLPCVEFQPWSLVLSIPLLRMSIARSIGVSFVSVFVSFFLRFFLCVVVIASSSLLVSYIILIFRFLFFDGGELVRSTEFCCVWTWDVGLCLRFIRAWFFMSFIVVLKHIPSFCGVSLCSFSRYF